MDNVKWVTEEMEPRDLSDLRLVDFDAFGCPAEPAKAFFNKFPVNQTLYVTFTDGSGLHNRYIQDEEGKKWMRSTYGVDRIPPADREGIVSNLDRFIEVQGREHGFKVQKISVAHGDANTIYAGYKLTPTGASKNVEDPRTKYKVRTVSKSVLKDYAGMNRPAAEELGFKPLPRKNEILVREDLTGKSREETISHEVREAEDIKKGDTYWQAHSKAIEREERKLE